MKTIYLVRHGQTYFNLYHKIQGRVDSPLTYLGIQQAKTCGKWVKEQKINFDHAYCSTSERASDTLELITDNQLPYKRLKGLREFAFGLFEGQDETLNPKPPYGDFFKQFGGETMQEVANRMMDTITNILETDVQDGQNCLIVSHGGSLMNFLRLALQSEKPLGSIHYPNCGVVVLTYQDGVYCLKDIVNPAEKVKVEN